MASQKPGPIFGTVMYKLKTGIYFILHYASIMKLCVFRRSKDHILRTIDLKPMKRTSLELKICEYSASTIEENMWLILLSSGY